MRHPVAPVGRAQEGLDAQEQEGSIPPSARRPHGGASTLDAQDRGPNALPWSRRRAPLEQPLNRWFAELSAEACIHRISSHGARHTSGSSYALAGASQKLIATMLGHSDTDATARYTHVQVEATAPVVEARWARLCGGKP
ncbi:MAG: tyrosine-type recombinase/integrase [Deltaproteobacteria bacterium]|nr:tyrosine-type recombinase/integrase [Deltaproteobacteria bacterium]